MIAYYGAYQQLFFAFTLYKPVEAKIENKKGMMNSMDWIVWEMLEKLKADKDILTRMRDEAKAICLDMTTVDMLYWKGLVAGYNTQIRWTQDNIDKLESMIEEEQRNDEAYDDNIRQLRGMTHE